MSLTTLPAYDPETGYEAQPFFDDFNPADFEGLADLPPALPVPSRTRAPRKTLDTTLSLRLRRYHPGAPGQLLTLAHGRYRVQSWRDRAVWYGVDLLRRTCTCKRFQKTRQRCKHVNQAIQFTTQRSFHTVNGILSTRTEADVEGMLTPRMVAEERRGAELALWVRRETARIREAGWYW